MLRFFSVHALGGILNFGVFSLIVHLGQRADLSGFRDWAMPWIGIWVGGLLGMSFNFALSSRPVFDEHA